MGRAALFALVLLFGCGLEERGQEPIGGAAGAAGVGGAIGGPDGGGWLDGSSGSAGAAGVTTDGAAGAGGTTVPGSEDCTNGKDDDGDKAVDCADSDCGGYQCFGEPPGGWNGPVALYQGSDPAPDCSQSGGYGTLKGDGGELSVGPVTCPDCTCDAAGVTCGAPTFATYGSNNCSGGELAKATFGTCSTLSSNSVQNSIEMTFPPAGGACSPQETGAKDIPPPTFSPVARACGAAQWGKGCGAGQVCTPKLLAPFTKICIYKPGTETTCPAGYANPELITVGVKDTRDCAACSCQRSCSYDAAVYDWACGGTQFDTLTASGQCGSAGGQYNLGVDLAATPGCTSSGGPIGTLEPLQVTVCCAS